MGLVMNEVEPDHEELAGICIMVLTMCIHCVDPDKLIGAAHRESRPGLLTTLVGIWRQLTLVLRLKQS